LLEQSLGRFFFLFVYTFLPLMYLLKWTRGTGLMGPTNIVAQELEKYGVRTVSAKEMAFNILGLMPPLLFSITQVEPI
jgi:fatty acid synthase subunit alpha, fungi type